VAPADNVEAEAEIDRQRCHLAATSLETDQTLAALEAGIVLELEIARVASASPAASGDQVESGIGPVALVAQEALEIVPVVREGLQIDREASVDQVVSEIVQELEIARASADLSATVAILQTTGVTDSITAATGSKTVEIDSITAAIG
jgi:hypothetical protein